MNKQEMLGNAKWIAAPEGERFAVLRSRFTLGKGARAKLRVVGLGFFHCYINGKRVSEDLFLPLSSDYEVRENYPTGETLSGHRLYVPEYDVTDYLREGENLIALHFGGGWYISENVFGVGGSYGESKAIFRLFGRDENGEIDVFSSERDELAPSFISDYDFFKFESQDYTRATECAVLPEYDGPTAAALEAKPLDTEYLSTECPADRVDEHLTVGRLESGVYDAGKNMTGYPVLNLKPSTGLVRISFSEELDPSGELSEKFSHKQTFTVMGDGRARTVRPLFTWFGFRYFTVEGDATVECVETVHTAVPVTSSFTSDNDLLNWIHDTFLNTQLSNMHAGIPSDCPHIERRGYTGDGQLVCHAAMTALGAEHFYRKWIGDIKDCQDVKTGHIQYTAPYVRSGGGPGGWGSAIVEVPYRFYRHYGDVSVLRDTYDSMLEYFRYLEEHSVSDLVVTDKEGEWCLGDWCTPISVVLPAPFVNNYFYIKALGRAIEIAKIIGRDADIPTFEERIEKRRAAAMRAYYNKWDGNFLGGAQGANAFALAMGLGDHRTYPNLVERYKREGGFDTGIFGTELVVRTLFERGDSDVALDLLLSESTHSFAEMRRRGATTIWEYWPESLRDRSHNHPMFGAVVACFYEYILGIRQRDGGCGYTDLIIEPMGIERLGRVKGHMTVTRGRVSVAYDRQGDELSVECEIPSGVRAVFKHGEVERPLECGANSFSVKLI